MLTDLCFFALFDLCKSLWHLASERKVDPLRHAQIRREVSGKVYIGHVEEIEQGKVSKESDSEAPDAE